MTPGPLNPQAAVQIKSFEKYNQRLFLFGMILLGGVFVSWIFIMFNQAKVTAFYMNPGLEERQEIEALENMAFQSEQEKELNQMLRQQIPIPGMVGKVLLVRAFQILVFTTGLFAVCFALQQKQLLTFFREIMQSQSSEKGHS